MTGKSNETYKRPRNLRAARPEAAAIAAFAPAAPTEAETAVPHEAAVTSVFEPTASPPSAPTSTPSPPVNTELPNATPQSEEIKMATAFETTKDNMGEAVKSTVSNFNESAESAMTTGKAAMEQVAAKAKDAAEASVKSIEEMTDVARGNVEALLASARVAAAGFETLSQHISEVSRKSFESTTTVARAMTSAKTPNELFQLQSDFAKTQFDHAVAEFSKMTEMMVKLSGEVMEPVQNRVAVTTDKMKSVFTK